MIRIKHKTANVWEHTMAILPLLPMLFICENLELGIQRSTQPYTLSKNITNLNPIRSPHQVKFNLMLKQFFSFMGFPQKICMLKISTKSEKEF